MAALAETANTRRDLVLGNIRIVKMQPTAAIANNDTWVPGLRIVEHVDIAANASGTTWGYTVTQGGGGGTTPAGGGPGTAGTLATITLLVSGATTATDITAWGY